MKRTGSGFTIVELLIVIVVIAILAAITIVSYNGITKQARETDAFSRMDAYIRAFSMYKAEHDTYPSYDLSGTAWGYVCLGNPSNFPQQGSFPAGSCYLNGNEVSYTKPDVNIALAKYISPLPAANLESVSVSNVSARGLLYKFNSKDSVELSYIIKGENAKCGRGDGQNAQGVTICYIYLR